MTSRISGGIIHITETADGNQFQIFSIVINGIINMLKFLAWSQIPYLIFFVPIGLILFIKSGNKYEKSLILVAISAIIPTLYAYSFASDSRYLFPIYPIFCIMSAYSIKYFLQKTTKPKSITILIFSIILVSSVLYLDWKDIDKVHELEAYNLAFEVSKITKLVNAYPPESSYLNVIGLTEVNDFPIKSEEYLKTRYVNLSYNKINSLQEFLENGKKVGMTHIVIDDKEGREWYLKEIFDNEDNYPYLIKEFDSKSFGYEYHLKIFKIDYEKIIGD